MPHEEKKKNPLQLNYSQPDKSESSDNPHISDTVMKAVRVDVQNPVIVPLRQQKQPKEKRSKTKHVKQKTPPGFAVRGFPVDPSLYHLIDNETFGPSEAVLDPERPNLLYSTNVNKRFSRGGSRKLITDKRAKLKNDIQEELQSQYGEDLEKDQTFDIVENGLEGPQNVVEGNKINRMLAELHDSAYDGASDEEIRVMFHGAIAGYESNREKELKQKLRDADEAEQSLVAEKEQLIRDGNMTDEESDAYDQARKELFITKVLWQNELAEISKDKKIKIKQGLQAQKKIYYRHLKRVVEKYGKYPTQMNVFDFMSVNPADLVGSDLGFLQNANLLLRYYPEIVDMSIKEDREFIAMLHFVQKMQFVITTPGSFIMADFDSASQNDSADFGSNPQRIRRMLYTKQNQKNLLPLNQNLALAGDMLQSLGVPMRGLSKKEGKAYMKSAQKRGWLQEEQKQALESIGKSPNISGFVKQCSEDLDTIKEKIKNHPIPGETGQSIKTLCISAEQFLIGHKPTNLSMLQAICWDLMKKCDTMFGSEYESLFENNDYESQDRSRKFCDLLEPFLIRLQFILQTQQNLIRIIGLE